MKSATTAVLAVAGVLAAAVGASAQSVTAHITADNHYQLYVGNADGSLLSFVGQNEAGSPGSPGSYNWSQAEN